MIITKVRLQEKTPTTNGTITWPLSFVDLELNPFAGENGYLLTDSAGLDPPDFISIVSGFDSAGVPVFDNATDKREVVLKIGLKPGVGQTYSSLRDALYKYVSRALCVSLMNGSTTVAQTSGFIKKCESFLFSNKPYVQLTIECDFGDFYAPIATSIPVAELNTLTPKITYENGTAPTGLDLQFTVTAVQSSFKFEKHNKLWYAGNTDINTKFEVTYGLLIGDVITINTHPKDRRINLLRSSVNYDLAGYINTGAVWPRLFSGVNAFEWTVSNTWATVNSASYIARYWGV